MIAVSYHFFNSVNKISKLKKTVVLIKDFHKILVTAKSQQAPSRFHFNMVVAVSAIVTFSLAIHYMN
jgi:hypothetical protein